MARRLLRECGSGVVAHPVGRVLVEATLAVEVRAPLWTQDSAAEFPLTAGKVQNLRTAARMLNGVEVAAGEVFSFWKQVGRTTARKGFTEGRELRSGCLVPAAGGGLCQLSGLLHEAALLAGLAVMERHAHSRTLPGVPLPPERDATIFWNYVDLRFRGDVDWRVEVELTDAELVVRLRMWEERMEKEDERVGWTGMSTLHRAAAEGDCHTCGVTSCFRHPSANRGHAPSSGHSAFLLDGRWPEFDAWCGRHARSGDRWFTPLDGRRWKKANFRAKARCGSGFCWMRSGGSRWNWADASILKRGIWSFPKPCCRTCGGLGISADGPSTCWLTAGRWRSCKRGWTRRLRAIRGRRR